MKSPFPGMDPYLEQHWGDIHTRLMVYMSDQINDQLPADLQARVEEDIVVDAEDARGLIYPDVRIVEEPVPIAADQVERTGAIAVAEPCLIALPEEPPPARHLEIVDRRSGNHVVTAIELLSPANKVGQEGRLAYHQKQSHYIEAGVNLVEVDLIRQGSFVLAVPEVLLSPDMSGPYFICVRRAVRRFTAEVVNISLREPLPNVKIPLRPSDSDVVLQLQPLLDNCYRRGRYATIDYSAPLRPELSPDDRHWIESLIHQS